MSSVPKIYKAISDVMADVGAVSKGKKNKDQGYEYRGIDDIYNALNPAMSKHGVIIIPNIKERQELDFATKSGASWRRVILTIEYTILCAEDGSSIQTTLIGEGSDNGDKGTNKAMSAAMKYLLLQIFCIPTENLHDDADGQNPPEEQRVPMQSSFDKCEDCGTEIVDLKRDGSVVKLKTDIKEYSEKNYGRCLCHKCIKKAKEAAEMLAEKGLTVDTETGEVIENPDVDKFGNKLPWEAPA